MIKKIFMCILLFAAIPALLFSGTTGKISGSVKDSQTGEPLAGANIIIQGTNLGAASDINGDYYIINVPPGLYTVKASMMGYKDVAMTQLRVTPDLTTSAHYKLDPEIIAGEIVTIIADKPLIQRDATFSGSVTSAEDIKNMPANSFTEVMGLSSGLIISGKGSADDSEEIHIRGGRANEIVYMIDGFYVKNPHSGGVAADVPNQGIQDLSIVTGSFNAEYGEAMSGVVNIVTKEGQKDYHGSARFSTDQFGVSDYDNGTMRTNYSFSGPVPFMKSMGNFFITGDNFNTDTYLHESKSHVEDIDGNPITRVHKPLTMNDRERYTGKLVLRPFSNLKLVGGFNHYYEKRRFYDDSFKEIPDHNGFDWDMSDLYHFTATHTISPKTFYNLKASWFKFHHKHELKSNLDEIVSPKLGMAFDETSNYEYYTSYDAGDSNFVVSDDDEWQKYTTKELSIMGDMTSQVHKNHMVKLGFEYKQYNIYEDRIRGVNTDGLGIHSEETHYDFEPVKMSTYIQDKMEFSDFVINAGLRFDYLDAQATYLPDFENPKPETYKKTKAKYRVSPRLGFGYPLTDKIKFHFAYGHFYQFPDFEMLYRRMNSRDSYGVINVNEGYRPRIGNANLKPQTTVNYEVGADVVISDELVGTVTVFYKDIYDYISTQFYDVDPRPYMAIVNLDYANTKGIEFSLRKRFSNHYSALINYTFSRAEGNADDWDTHYLEYQNASVTGQIIPKKTVTLEWDQPHTVNVQFDVRWRDNWGINLIGSFGSGLPYTPSDARGRYLGEVNSARMPWTGSIDMRLNKDFKFAGLRYRLFANVWNILDKKNVLNVFNNSGRADYSTNPNSSKESMHNPHWYGPPRTIELGLQVEF